MENYCLEHNGTYGSPTTPPLATPHMITQNFPQVVIITQVVMITQHFSTSCYDYTTLVEKITR